MPRSPIHYRHTAESPASSGTKLTGLDNDDRGQEQPQRPRGGSWITSAKGMNHLGPARANPAPLSHTGVVSCDALKIESRTSPSSRPRWRESGVSAVGQDVS